MDFRSVSKRRHSGLLLVVLVVAILAPISLATAQESLPEEDTSLISNVFFDTDLRQAIEDIAAQAGVNIIVDPSVGGLVTAELENATLDEALALILAGTEFQVSQTDDYYLVFSADESSLLFSDVAQTRIVPLQSTDAEMARQLLPEALQRFVRSDTQANALVVTASGRLLSRIIEDVEKIDNSSAGSTRIVSLDHIAAVTARDMLPSALRRFVSVDETGNALAITAPDSQGRRIEMLLSRLDVRRSPGSVAFPEVYRTEVVKLAHSTAENVLAMLPAALSEHVRADPQSNSISISLPQPLLDEVKEDLAKLDMPRRHVMLDARVVVLERGDLLSFGVDWSFPQVTAGTFANDETGSNWPWEMRIGYTPGREFTNALSLTLNMLSQNNEATVVASPQVLAQDGKEAEISVTTEEFFQITSEQGSFIRAQLEKIETGTILRITPRVGNGGELMLDMQIEVSDVIARGSDNLPVVSRRTAMSSVQIESGGTAAVAGLLDTRLQDSRSGVPGASNLPLLGRAFRTDGLNHQSRQVAVFITATLVDQEDEEFSNGRQNVSFPIKEEQLFRQELESALRGLEGEGA